MLPKAHSSAAELGYLCKGGNLWQVNFFLKLLVSQGARLAGCQNVQAVWWQVPVRLDPLVCVESFSKFAHAARSQGQGLCI